MVLCRTPHDLDIDQSIADAVDDDNRTDTAQSAPLAVSLFPWNAATATATATAPLPLRPISQNFLPKHAKTTFVHLLNEKRTSAERSTVAALTLSAQTECGTTATRRGGCYAHSSLGRRSARASLLPLLVVVVLAVVMAALVVVNDIVFEDKRTPFGDPLVQQRRNERIVAQETKELVGVRGTEGVMAKGD